MATTRLAKTRSSGRSSSLRMAPTSTAVTQPLMLMCLGVGAIALSTQLNQKPVPAQVTPSPKPVAPLPQLPWGDRAYDTKLIVDLSDRVVYLYRDQKLKASYRVAIGMPKWETPVGSFRIRQMVTNPTWKHPLTDEIFPPGAANPLGDRWVGFAADEHMKLGFHGTQQEKLIGQAVSHGCLRMTNRDVRDLYNQVSIGTEVAVRP